MNFKVPSKQTILSFSAAISPSTSQHTSLSAELLELQFTNPFTKL